MLLVLAAQAGFFGPPLRVLGGALLSGALVFAGVRVHGRPGGKVGAIALAATGFAGMYLDVVAASVLYGWVTTPLAVAIAFGIAAAGVALGVKWDSESLALMIDLVDADDSTTVTDVAVRWGFTHTGRFASSFRRKYGVLPSEVLRS